MSESRCTSFRGITSQRRILSIAAAVLMAVLLPLGSWQLPVAAGPWEKLEEDRQRITGGIDETAREEDRILAELFNLGLELEAAREELARLQKDMESVASALVKAGEDLAVLEAKLSEREERLKRRLRFMYEDGSVSYLEVLLSSASFQDFLSRLDLIRMIASADASLVREVKALKVRVETERAALQARRDELAGLRSRAEARQARITRLILEKEQRLSGLRDKRSAFESALADLERVWAGEALPVIKALTAEFQGSTHRLRDMEPDEVRYRLVPPAVILTVSESTLNGFLQGGSPEIQSLRFRLRSTGAELSGTYSKVDLVLRGKLVIEGETRVRFLPDEIIFSGFRVSPEAVRIYVEPLRMEIDFAEFVRPAGLIAIEIKEGLLVVEASVR